MKRLSRFLVTTLCIALFAVFATGAFICSQVRSIVEHDIPYGHTQVSRMVFEHDGMQVSERTNAGWGYRYFLSNDEAERLYQSTDSSEIILQLKNIYGDVMQLPDHRPMEVRLLRSSLEQMVLEGSRSTGNSKLIGRNLTFVWQPGWFYTNNQSDAGADYELHVRSLRVYNLQSWLMTRLDCSRHTTLQMFVFGELASIIGLLAVTTFVVARLVRNIEAARYYKRHRVLNSFAYLRRS